MFSKIFHRIEKKSSIQMFFKSVRYASILADGGGSLVRQTLSSSTPVNFVNSKSPLQYEQISKLNYDQYVFPPLVFEYNKEDVVQHALAVGMKMGDRSTHHFLNTRHPNFQVFPTFLLPLVNKICRSLGYINHNKSVHAELYFELMEPFQPEGVLNVETRVPKVFDKGKGTLYHFWHTATCGNAPIFVTESKYYELGTGGWGGKASNPNKSIGPISHPDESADAKFEFTTQPLKNHDGINDEEMSIFSVEHPKQFYALTEGFNPNPICHGRYYVSAVLHLILQHYCANDGHRFKRLVVRLTNPVYPSDTLKIQCWKRGNRIHFEAGKKATGENVLKGGYVDLVSE